MRSVGREKGGSINLCIRWEANGAFTFGAVCANANEALVAARKTEANVVLSSLFIVASKGDGQNDRMFNGVRLAVLRRYRRKDLYQHATSPLCRAWPMES